MDVRRMILDNWTIKLLSFGLSLTLWFYVTSTGKTELTLKVPVELRNIPPGMMVVGDVASSVEVRMQGQERILRDGGISRTIIAFLDLSMTKEGNNVVRISPYDVKVPAGTIITHLSQSEISVHLERIVRKAFRLRPVLRGRPAKGFRMAGTTVTPARIMIEGPASAVRMLNKLETLPIDIQQATQSVTVSPKIDYQGKPVKLMEKEIAVIVRIERTEK